MTSPIWTAKVTLATREPYTKHRLSNSSPVDCDESVAKYLGIAGNIGTLALDKPF